MTRPDAPSRERSRRPWRLRAFGPAVSVAELRPVRLQGLTPCKEHVASVGCYACPEVAALLGFSSSRFSRAAPGVGLSRPPSPLGLPRPRPRTSRERAEGPSGSCRRRAWTPLLRGASTFMRFSTLSSRLPVRHRGHPWLPPVVRAGPFGPSPHPLPLEPRGCVAAPLQALFGLVARCLACALRERVYR